MQSTSPPPWQWPGDIPAPPPPPPTPPPAPAAPRGRRRVAPITFALAFTAAAMMVGILLGGRASAEDGIAAARQALAAGDAARAVTLDEAIASRNGLLMVFDPGARGSAHHDAQVARIAWAKQLGASGKVDAAVAALKQVGEPALIGPAAEARTQLLVSAAASALKDGHASLALRRLDEAAVAASPTSMIARIASLRADAEVSASRELAASGRFVDALTLLDQAAASGAAAAAQPLYPAALLAAAQDELAAEAFQDAAATLQKLLDQHGGSHEASTARTMLQAPQTVSGTLVDAAGHSTAVRVRLASNYSVVSGGYLTSGPFYYADSDGAGNFSLPGVPVGGPYVLEYLRGGGWQTLVDPHTYQPANTVTVKRLTPVDLTFIVFP